VPLTPGRALESLFSIPPPLTVVEEAGHFLQEDQGEQIGARRRLAAGGRLALVEQRGDERERDLRALAH
jgi:hypothetical protein